MSNSTLIQLLPNLCDAASSLSKSWSSTTWFVVANLGLKGWLLVIGGLIVWIAFEVIAGGGKAANGHSPTLNVAVGSTTYAIFNTLLQLFLQRDFW
jgi:hypothetical protein